MYFPAMSETHAERGGRSARALCRAVLAVVLVFSSAGAGAQLPLSIGQLFTDESALRLSVATSVYAQQNAGQSAAPGLQAPQRIDPVDAQLQNLAVTLRYGVLAGLEFNASYSASELRTPLAGGAFQNSAGHAVSVGFSWLASPEGRWPALLLDGAADVVQKLPVADVATSVFGGMQLGLTLFRSLDPVVLSVAAAYRMNSPTQAGAGRIAGSRVLELSPQVNFALNSRVTLIGGLTWSFRRVDRFADARRVRDTRASAVRLGLGYAAGARSTLFCQTDIGTSGYARGAGISLEWLYDF